MELSDWLTIAALVVGSAGFLVGIRTFDPGKPIQLLLAFADVGLLAWGIVALGALGIGIFAGATILALLGHSVHRAFKVDGTLTYAATQASATREEMHALHQRIWRSPPTWRAFVWLGYLGAAQLISELAQRNRSTSEIEDMARPIALLWSVHRPDLSTFVDKFDRLMRLNGEPSSQAMRVADVITVGVRESAGRFEEMLDAYIAVSEVAGLWER